MPARRTSIALRSGLAALAVIASVALLPACGDNGNGGDTISEESGALAEQLRAEGLSEPVIDCVVRELDAAGISTEDVGSPQLQRQAVKAGRKCAQR